MNISYTLQGPHQTTSVTLDPDHHRIATKSEDVLDSLHGKVNWELADHRQQFQSHIQDLLGESGYRLID